MQVRYLFDLLVDDLPLFVQGIRIFLPGFLPRLRQIHVLGYDLVAVVGLARS